MKRPPISALQTRRSLRIETNLLWFRGGLQPEVLDSLGGLWKVFICALLLLLPSFLQLPGIYPLVPRRNFWYLEAFLSSLTFLLPRLLDLLASGERVGGISSIRSVDFPAATTLTIISSLLSSSTIDTTFFF